MGRVVLVSTALHMHMYYIATFCNPCPYIDINECNGANDCSGTCYNTVGSYSCDCPEGKELGDDGVTCERT